MGSLPGSSRHERERDYCCKRQPFSHPHVNTEGVPKELRLLTWHDVEDWMKFYSSFASLSVRYQIFICEDTWAHNFQTDMSCSFSIGNIVDAAC